MKKLLVAVDGSAPSVHATRLALELSRATNAALTVVYAVARLIVGSVADRLVHICKKPVLVVR